MLTSALLHSLIAVGIFFLLLILCAMKELSMEKSLAAAGLWTGLFLLFWQELVRL